MTQREEFGQILAAAFVGSMIGAALFVGGMTLIMLAPGTELYLILYIAPFALVIGCVVAALTAWPLGTLVAWLVSRTGPVSDTNAVLGGALTGFGLIAAVLLLGSDFPAVGGVTEWVYLAGFALLGAISGLSAHRIRLASKAPA